MGNGQCIDDFPIHISIYKGFSMAMLNNQRVNPHVFILTPPLIGTAHVARFLCTRKDVFPGWDGAKIQTSTGWHGCIIPNGGWFQSRKKKKWSAPTDMEHLTYILTSYVTRLLNSSQCHLLANDHLQLCWFTSTATFIGDIHLCWYAGSQ